MVQYFLNRNYIFACALVLLTAGCAHKSLVSQKLPLISHAHVGHALTAWHGTPDEQGLFVVAESETQIAINETRKALKAATNRPLINEHLSNALHALDPYLQPKGKGLGYGAIRALDEATDHMLYASQSKDASENMVRMVHRFNDSQVNVSNKMKLAVEVIHLARKAKGHEQQELLTHLQNTLHATLDGEDKDQNGEIGSTPQEIGLLQLREIISEGLRHEVPAYEPVGKKYLLGLVRLSNGNWAYEFEATNNRKKLAHSRRRSGYGY